MANEFKQKRIAVLAANGFEEATLTQPVKALEEAGAQVDLISLEKTIRSWKADQWGDEFTAAVLLNEVKANKYDALLLPGGIKGQEQLRTNTHAVNFVRHFLQDGKLVAAIGYGAGILIETGLIRGRKVTADPSLKNDLQNAGGQWAEEPIIADRGILTGSTSVDISDFIQKMIEELRQGVSIAGRGIAAQGSLPGEGAEVPNRGHEYRRG
jgi:protease I